MPGKALLPGMTNERRAGLVVGIVLVLLGLCLLALNLASWFLAGLGIELELWRLWPIVFVLAALAFYVPIVIGWDNRNALRWLAVPGTILLANGLILLYTSLTDDWGAWGYLWTLEPLAVGVGLYSASLLGQRDQGAETGGMILGGISLVGFVLFGSLLGSGIVRIVAPLGLIVLGLLILAVGIFRRS